MAKTLNDYFTHVKSLTLLQERKFSKGRQAKIASLLAEQKALKEKREAEEIRKLAIADHREGRRPFATEFLETAATGPKGGGCGGRRTGKASG
jgi:hypothetical protein